MWSHHEVHALTRITPDLIRSDVFTHFLIISIIIIILKIFNVAEITLLSLGMETDSL